jgi:hypothetical protein
LLLLLLCWLSLSSCSSRSITMVHPQSGATAKCGASGTGLMAAEAGRIVEECVKSYEGRGYMAVKNLTPEQRADLERRGLLPKGEVAP